MRYIEGMKRLLLLGFACLGLSGCVVAEQPQYGYASTPRTVYYEQAPQQVIYERAPVYVQPAPAVVAPVYFGGYHGGYYHRRGYR